MYYVFIFRLNSLFFLGFHLQQQQQSNVISAIVNTIHVVQIHLIHTLWEKWIVVWKFALNTCQIMSQSFAEKLLKKVIKFYNQFVMGHLFSSFYHWQFSEKHVLSGTVGIWHPIMITKDASKSRAHSRFRTISAHALMICVIMLQQFHIFNIL